MTSTEIHRFNSLIINFKQGIASSDGCDDSVVLDDKSLQLIKLLAEAGADGCSRDVLLSTIWNDKIVSDDSLTNLVSQTRSKLSNLYPGLIKTVPKKGYKIEVEHSCEILGGIKHIEPETIQTEANESKRTVSGDEENKEPGFTKFKILIPMVILAGLFLAVGIFVLVPNSQTKKQSTIAILPIEAFSNDEFVKTSAASFTEELTHQFTNFPGIYIVSRTAAARVADSELSLQDMSEQLSARYLIEGSLRESENKIRINVQLTDGETGLHIFSKSMTAKKSNFVSKTNRIIQSISRLVISEIPAQFINKEAKPFDSIAIAKKCESYLELSKLYSDFILEDVYSIATPAETACIAYSQLEFGNATARSKIAELYMEMAIATQASRNEKLSFIQLAHQYTDQALQSNSKESAALVIKARLHFLQMEDALNNGLPIDDIFAAANESLNEGLKYHPNNIGLLNSKGEIYRNIGVAKRRKGESPLVDFKVAEESFTRVIEIDSETDVAWAKLARLQMSTAAYFNDIGQSPIEKLKQSIVSYGQASLLAPKKPMYYVKKGDSLSVVAGLLAASGKEYQGFFDKASEEFQKALDIAPSLFEAQSSLADSYRRRAKVDFAKGLDSTDFINLAIDAGNRALELNPDFVWSYFTMMEIHRTGYQLDYATQKGLSIHSKGCIEFAQKGMAIKNDSARSWVSLIDCKQTQVRVFIEDKQFDAAQTLLENIDIDIKRLLELDPTYSYGLQINGIQLLLRQVSNGTFQYTKALELLERAQALNPTDKERKIALLEAMLYQFKHKNNDSTVTWGKFNSIFGEGDMSHNSDEILFLKAAYLKALGEDEPLTDIQNKIGAKSELTLNRLNRKYHALL
ncbi:MAG: winged helix-turn-helix domain-containing protein [Kangiellaceae bacterium]|nr:winged helix-turn-helix domain-containing protein [Kangiellaceae bacterium]